ncbi:peptidase S66 [Xenorhabdus vietnamensis]|uniref:Peptidase S66 n=1 Tax=Xenorhabdus vietnamensis TaxID=351656 RepID=A0A1Y2SCN7_9GAMM|nr:S66 peptidase family protein [Xenorhabdus vietnamensis]OTA16498.1 peptidase S66 [Xenorhabdus vietnamensis]
MILPQRLSLGETIGFFSSSAPATAFAPTRFTRSINYLQSKGYKTKAGILTGKSDFYRSGNIMQRVEEFNTLLRDPEVRCIMSTIGGDNSNSILPYIDYDAIKKDPKIIVGYSDTTALLLGIYSKTNVVTFYGPALVASFGEYPPLVDETFACFSQIITNTQPPFTYKQPEYWTDEYIEWENQIHPKNTFSNKWIFDGTGKYRGRLIGGNLNTLYGIWGSEYMPEIKQGDILLIEDCHQGIEEVERAFAHLLICGIFNKASAIILGKHEQFNDRGTGRTALDVLKEVLNGKEMPIVADFDCCHTHPMLTMPLGVDIVIDFDSESVFLPEPWCVN